MNLAWDLKELEDLNKEGRLLLTEVNILQDVLVSDEHGCDINLPRWLTSLRKSVFRTRDFSG
jgi:hypothetical protein